MGVPFVSGLAPASQSTLSAATVASIPSMTSRRLMGVVSA